MPRKSGPPNKRPRRRPSQRRATIAQRVSPEQHFAAMRSRYERFGRAEIKSYPGAIEAVKDVGMRCDTLHAAIGRNDAGNYRDAVLIVWDITQKWHAEGLPPLPDAAGHISLATARTLISGCLELLMDRTRTEYWDWRIAVSPHHGGGTAFVAWHVDAVRAIWDSHLGDGPEDRAAINVLERVRREFHLFHTLWAVPHLRRPDYLHVASYVHEVVVRVVPEPPPPPLGLHPFIRLDAFITSVVDLIAKTGASVRLHPRRGRRPHTSPEDDRRVAAAWEQSGETKLARFAEVYGIPLPDLRAAIDRHRHRVNHPKRA